MVDQSEPALEMLFRLTIIALGILAIVGLARIENGAAPGRYTICPTWGPCY